MIVELAILFCLFVINGLFAMGEIAIVSSRPGRLQQLAKQGDKGAAVALELSRDPGLFLSACQTGITLIAILTGAFSGATIAGPAEAWLTGIPVLAPYAETLSIAIVVVATTYFSLVIGELVPKQLGLRNPEAIAARSARPIALIARLGAPIVWVLRGSSDAMLWLLRATRKTDKGVTEEEIRLLVAQGTEEGEIHVEERKMIDGVLRLADRTVRSVMTPRPDVIWIDPEDDEATLKRDIRACDYSRVLVSRGEIDNVLGHVRKKDLLDQILDGRRIDVMSVLRQPLVLPDQTSVLRALERFKTVAVHLAVVVDEYGSLEGIVTQTDILEAIAGDLPEHDAAAPEVFRRADGSYLLDGALDIHDATQLLGLPKLEEDDEGAFDTLAGLVLARLKRVPTAGDHFTWGGWRFEVVDMDDRRIDKVLAAKAAEEESST